MSKIKIKTMSEAVIFNPSQIEQHVLPTANPAADTIFMGVYGAFAQEAQEQFQNKQTSASRQEYIKRGIFRPDIEPHIDFVKKRFNDSERLEKYDRPAALTNITETLMQEAEVEARRQHGEKPVAIGAIIEKSRRVVVGFVDRASEMLANGEVDELTVKSFFGRMESFKISLSTGYNSLIAKKDEPVPDVDTRARFTKQVFDEYSGHPDIQEQKDAGFLHVNGRRHQNSDFMTTDRYYITPLLNGSPEKVLKIWVDTLKELGLDQKLYYKVALELPRRYEIITAYADAEMDTELQQALANFKQRCPAELLSESTLPSGLALHKGVVRAPNPEELNRLIRYVGKNKVSYNQLACALTELALQRAAYERRKQGVDAVSTTPRALADAAKPFFSQYLKLAGIDPKTMKVIVGTKQQHAS